VHALGEVDELNAIIGMLLTEPLEVNIHAALEAIQHDLFDLGGELCMPGYTLVKPERITALETQLDAWNEQLEPLKEFILPGGSRAAAYCHLARAVCRRAERAIYALNEKESLNPCVLQYINRLSDMLFVLCRILNKNADVSDILWRNPGK
jgi:cob(I)alamin adenosyltransferase